MKVKRMHGNYGTAFRDMVFNHCKDDWFNLAITHKDLTTSLLASLTCGDRVEKLPCSDVAIAY